MSTYTYATERDFRYGLVFGNHASVPDFDATSWTALNSTGIPIEGSVMFNKDAQMRRPPRANSYRNLVTADHINDKNGAIPQCTFSNVPATTATLDFFLYGIFQKVTEAASTPYVKDFVFPATDGAPDFQANAGAFYTLIKEAASGTTSDEAILSAVPASLTLSCYPGQNEGRLTVSIDWIGRYHQELQTYSGTLTYPSTFAYWNFANLKSAKVGGTNVICYGFTFTMTNGLKPIPIGGYSTAGLSTQTYALPFYACSGSIDLLWDATVRTEIGNETSSIGSQILLAWGSGADPITTNGDLLIKALPQFNSNDTQGTEESIRRLNFECIENTGVTEAFEVHMANAVDRAW